MAEIGVASLYTYRPAADGACRPLRPAEVGEGRAGTARHARPLSGGGLTLQSPAEVGAEMGKGVVRALRLESGKRPANLERGRQVRGMRDGFRILCAPRLSFSTKEGESEHGYVTCSHICSFRRSWAITFYSLQYAFPEF
ncbi:uncharacterized protein [Lolium perenne]|uniref:uncharacterized protein isoform X2 n=1 Tax=Lolium perenne TaxID=4522 RepID=UPI003A997614